MKLENTLKMNTEEFQKNIFHIPFFQKKCFDIKVIFSKEIYCFWQILSIPLHLTLYIALHNFSLFNIHICKQNVRSIKSFMMCLHIFSRLAAKLAFAQLSEPGKALSYLLFRTQVFVTSNIQSFYYSIYLSYTMVFKTQFFSKKIKIQSRHVI